MHHLFRPHSQAADRRLHPERLGYNSANYYLRLGSRHWPGDNRVVLQQQYIQLVTNTVGDANVVLCLDGYCRSDAREHWRCETQLGTLQVARAQVAVAA